MPRCGHKSLIDSVIYEIAGNTVVMHFSQNRAAFVDKADLELVMQHRWYMDKRGYVRSTKVELGRLILGLTDRWEFADHTNRNPADNRRLNLRKATPSQNARNTGTHQGKTYKGVYCRKGVYSASISLGSFATAEEAAKAYDRVAVLLFGEFAFTNFGKSAAEPSEGQMERSTTRPEGRSIQVGAK